MRASSQSPLDLHVLGVPPAFVLSQDQTLYDSCIGTALAVDIDPWHHDLFRSQLPVWFFRLFWLLKVPNFFGFSRVLYFVVHCSIFKVPRRNSWAATFILYHISKFLSSELFVNVFELSFIPSSRLSAFLFFFCDHCRVRQPIYYITLLSFCQVNKLWTRSGSFHLFFPDSLAFPCDSLSIISHLSLLVKWTFCEVFTPPLFTLLRFPATALLLYHLLPLLSSKLPVKFYCWILWRLNK